MPTNVRFLTEAGIAHLRSEIINNLPKYKAGKADDIILAIDSNTDFVTELDNCQLNFQKLHIGIGGNNRIGDHAKNVFIPNLHIIYTSFHNLTPHDAIDNFGIFVYYAHKWGDYVNWRWPLDNLSSDDATNRIDSHYFGKEKVFDFASLIQNQEIYSQWITMHVCSEIVKMPECKLNLNEILEILYSKWHFRHRLLDYPPLLCDKNITLAILTALSNYKNKNKNGFDDITDNVYRGTDNDDNENVTFNGFVRLIDRRMSGCQFAVPEIFTQDELNLEFENMLYSALQTYRNYKANNP